MNLIVGNSAGAFSTILLYLKWMVVKKFTTSNLSLYFYWSNKTDFYGNSLFDYNSSNYRILNYNQVDKVYFERPNLYDDLFEKKQNKNLDFDVYTEDHPYTMANMIDSYPDIFWKHTGDGSSINQYFDIESLATIRNLYHNEWNELGLSKNIKLKIEEETKIFKEKKTLAVMLRCSRHYFDKFDINDLLNETKKYMKDYDNLLIITQIEEFFDLFLKEFGDLCIFPNRKRISGDSDWKGNDGSKIMTSEEYVKEVEDCIIDVSLVSKADHILSGASNMFLGALIMNPNITFNIFDSLKDINGA